ncbi:MAG: OsmC family protein [Nannocystaceae bacterium]
MSEHPEYTATILWERPEGASFIDRRYTRDHAWSFDGLSVPASASPFGVRPPLTSTDRIDPEEALVAALSSCHMLTFLWVAARRGLVVDRYEDHAAGVLGKNAEGRIALVRAVLRPEVTFGADAQVDAALLDELHEAAHRDCYIANSVKTEVAIEPRIAAASAS